MNAPVETTNIDLRTALSDEVIVNRDGSTGVQKTSDLAIQLAGTGRIADEFDTVRGIVNQQLQAVRELATKKWISFSSKSAMDANLSFSAGTEARVYADPGKGVYSKSGAAASGSWVYSGPLPETDLTEINSVTAEERGGLSQTPTAERKEFTLDSKWMWRVGNPYGDTALGVDLDGVLHAMNMFDAGVYGLTDNLAKLFVTEGGIAFAGIDWDGEWKSAAQIFREVDLFAAVVSGSSKIFASVRGTIIPLTFGTEVGVDPRRKGRDVRYYVPSGNTFIQKDEEVLAKTSALETTTRLVLSLVHGQSLSRGDVSKPPQSTTAVRPGRALMFNGGAVVNGVTNEQAEITTPRANQFELVDLKENVQESPASQLGYEVSRPDGLPVSNAVLVSSHGKGATPYSGLKRGTVPYANLLAAVRRSRIIAGLNNFEFATPFVHYIQGEDNISDPLGSYKANLAELRADLNADIQTYLVAGADVLLFVDQISNWTKYGAKPARSEVPLAQLQASLDDPTKIICVCPKYFLPTASDGIHLSPASSAVLGAYHGRAERQTRLGSVWKPLYMTSAVRTGTKVVVTFNVPSGALVIDTTTVSFLAGFGFEWLDSGNGNSVSIAAVAPPVGNTIELTLSAIPTATGQKLGYALTGVSDSAGGPTTGPRGNLRDSSSDVTSTGYVMRNWACHQLINVS